MDNRDKERKTLNELAMGSQNGLVCPKCGCNHFNVLDTRNAKGVIRRRRECRHCGRRISTVEEKVTPGKHVQAV